MQETRKVFYNAALSSGAGIVSSLASMAFFAYAPRFLGVLQWGYLKSAGALVDLFYRFADLGVSTVTVRRVAKSPEDWESHLASALGARFCLAIFTCAAAILSSVLLSYPAEIRILVVILALGLLPTSVGTSLLLPFNGLERFQYSSIPPVCVNILYVASKIEAVRRGQSLTVLVLLTVAQACLLACVSVFLVLHVLKGKIRRASARRMASLVREALPFAAAGLFANLYWNLDMVLLQRMKDAEAVGIYSAAYTFANFGMRLCAGLGAALLPAMSRRGRCGPSSLSKALVFCMKLGLWVGLPGALATQLLAGDMIRIVLSEKFARSALPLSILIWSVFFILINSMLYDALYSLHKERATTWLFGSMVLLNVGLNLALIPKYSYIGSAGATVACEVVNCLVCLLVLRRELSLSIPHPRSLLLLLPGAAMAGSIYVTRGHLGIFSAIPGILAFLVFSGPGVLALTREEREALAEIPALRFLKRVGRMEA